MTTEETPEPDGEPHLPKQPGNQAREQFVQANASLAIEGMYATEFDRSVQERIAAGELSADEAVALYLDAARSGRL